MTDPAEPWLPDDALAWSEAWPAGWPDEDAGPEYHMYHDLLQAIEVLLHECTR
jgi:hypothetical protein